MGDLLARRPHGARDRPGQGRPEGARLPGSTLAAPRIRAAVGCVLAAAILLAAVSVLVIGCTTVVVTPRDPVDPVSVFVVDEGYHAALLLPREGGGCVAYTFGDWDYFALEKDDLWHGFLALAIPTGGALGRTFFHGVESLSDMESRFPGFEVFELAVERRRVEDLAQRLDERFASRIETSVRSDAYGLDFVEDETSYIWYRNCNTVLVGWLEELGCDGRGTGLWADFSVRTADRGESASPEGAGAR